MKRRLTGFHWTICIACLACIAFPLGACMPETPALTEDDKAMWVHYLHYLDGNIHRCRLDGSEDTVTDVPQYMSRSGDWIYQSGGRDLFREKADGTEETRVATGECYDLHVLGDVVVFLDAETDLSEGEGVMRIYRVRTDGTGRERICKDHVQFHEFHACGEWILYRNLSDAGAIYRIRPDGTGRERVASSATRFATSAGWVYCGSDSLYRMRPDGSERVAIVEDAIDAFVIGEEGWVYYVNGSDGDCVYKVKTDGTGRAKVADGPAEDVGSVGDWVFFRIRVMSAWNENALSTKRVRSNGTGLARMNSDHVYYDPFAED